MSNTIINSLVTSTATMMAPKGKVLPDLAAQAKAKAVQQAKEIAEGRTLGKPKSSFDVKTYDLEATYLPYLPTKGKNAGKQFVRIGWKHKTTPFFNMILKYNEHVRLAALILASIDAGHGDLLRQCVQAELNSSTETEE